MLNKAWYLYWYRPYYILFWQCKLFFFRLRVRLSSWLLALSPAQASLRPLKTSFQSPLQSLKTLFQALKALCQPPLQVPLKSHQLINSQVLFCISLTYTLATVRFKSLRTVRFCNVFEISLLCCRKKKYLKM